MNKKYLLVLIAISALFIVGCAEEEAPSEFEKAFIGGTEGLEMQFTEGAPPNEVYDRDFPFNINVRLENAGEWDITTASDITVSISGVYPADFGKTLAELKQDSTVPLTGAHLDQQGNVLEGTIANIDFADFEYQQPVIGRADFNLRADVCYEYGTRVNSQICVLDELLRADEDAICNPNELKDYENSGGPVHITSVRQTATGANRITVTFEISHLGDGLVFRRNTECSTAIADKDKVFMRVDTGLTGLSCAGIEGGSGEGFVTLYNGARQVICTQELPSPRGDYEKQITAELTYGYRENIYKTLTVKQTGS